MKNFIIFFRIFLWLILAIIVGCLLYLGIVPNGKISYATNFSKPGFFIGKLTPAERIENLNSENGNGVKITGDPVYFALRTPRPFNKAKLIIRYKGSKSPTGPLEPVVIEIGPLVDKTIWRYNLKPIMNKIIDQLALVWDVKKDSGLMLLQRKDSASSTVYANINDFLNNPPESGKIAVYNYNLQLEYLLPDYKSSMEDKPAIPPLRGACQFYTYIKNEDLDFAFDITDINKNKDNDPVDIDLYCGEQKIDTRHLDDDGIADDKGREGKVRQIDFKIAGLPEGVYKIELRANDDIISNITTKQNKLAFINQIRLADGKTKNISLFTDSDDISAETVNPGRLQEIKINGQTLNLNQTYKMFSLSAGSGIKKINLEKPDLILAGNGVFSFSESALINPAIKKVDGNLDVKKIDYVLARYESPREENGWQTAEAEFDLSKAYREGGKYSFLISIPGLKTDDGDDGVEIREIKAELEGTTLLKRIKYIFIH